MNYWYRNRSLSGTKQLFYECKNLNQPLPYWNIGDADLTGFFYGCEDIGSIVNGLRYWDVSNVTNMSDMFAGCTWGPAQGIVYWDVSKVTSMSGMFSRCNGFDGNLSNWNVGNVTNMSGMFNQMFQYGAPSQNTGLTNWDVSKVTNMTSMFNGCSVFDQNLSNWKVTQIATKPTDFDTGTSVNWTTAEKPNWGV